MTDHVLTETAGGVLTVRINRPDKRNAITQDMYQALGDALVGAEADPTVRVVVFTGSGGAFTAGNELADIAERDVLEPSGPTARFIRALIDTSKVLIAEIDGAAIGIGTTMLLHCDLVYVSDEARLAMPFVTLGLVPEYASSLLIPQRVGHAKATELLLLGEPFNGETAVELGIANAVLPAAEVVNHARRMAERFNALPPGAVRETKALMRRGQKALVADTIDAEAAIFSTRLRSPEAMEAFQAFFQKRKPDFSKF
jgi:enoyl-CoA hydratase/carnithine racemase